MMLLLCLFAILLNLGLTLLLALTLLLVLLLGGLLCLGSRLHILLGVILLRAFLLLGVLLLGVSGLHFAVLLDGEEFAAPGVAGIVGRSRKRRSAETSRSAASLRTCSS